MSENQKRIEALKMSAADIAFNHLIGITHAEAARFVECIITAATLTVINLEQISRKDDLK